VVLWHLDLAIFFSFQFSSLPLNFPQNKKIIAFKLMIQRKENKFLRYKRRLGKVLMQKLETGRTIENLPFYCML